MTPLLTYRPRDGFVRVQLPDKTSQLATVRNQASMTVGVWQRTRNSNRATGWDKSQEIRPGSAASARGTMRLAVADHAALEIFDYPGAYAQRFDGTDQVNKHGAGHNRLHTRIVRVSTRGADGANDFFIHNAPACGNACCIVVVQGWESLLETLSTARQVSLVVEL
jgi:hypothetical protein